MHNEGILHCAPSCTAVLQDQQLHKHRRPAATVGTTHGSGAPILAGKPRGLVNGLGAAHRVLVEHTNALQCHQHLISAPGSMALLSCFHLLHLFVANGVLEMKLIIRVVMYVYYEYHHQVCGKRLGWQSILVCG